MCISEINQKLVRVVNHVFIDRRGSQFVYFDEQIFVAKMYRNPSNIHSHDFVCQLALLGRKGLESMKLNRNFLRGGEGFRPKNIQCGGHRYFLKRHKMAFYKSNSFALFPPPPLSLNIPIVSPPLFPPAGVSAPLGVTTCQYTWDV